MESLILAHMSNEGSANPLMILHWSQYKYHLNWGNPNTMQWNIQIFKINEKHLIQAISFCFCDPLCYLCTALSMINRKERLVSECDEYIRIFEYSNILVMNIYSDIRSYQFFFYEYIRTFVRVKFVGTNIFGHSLVSVLECKT